MLRPLPESIRFRCLHRVLMPRYRWSADGELIRLTDESLNPTCAVCSGPLTAGRKTPRQTEVEPNETELMETI
jgi:hypothetical protein